MNKLLVSSAMVAVSALFATQAFAVMNSVSDSAVKDVVNKVDEEYDIPEWLERVEFQSSFGGKPEWSILTVQPLYQTEDMKHTFFTQLSALNYEQFGTDRTTTNIGFGYRQLVLDEKLLLGVNSFYDHEWEYDHERLGLGVEARSNALEFNANYYDAISGVKSIDTNITEQALDGYDAELGLQIPYLPWAKVFAKTYKWQGDVSRDTIGRTYSMRLQPTQWLEFEAGRDDSNNYEGENFAKVNFRFAFNEPNNSKPLIDNKPFAFNESMKDKTLEKVRRTNKIVVERVTNAGGGLLTVVVGRGS